MRDKILGMVVGGAVGDALGAPVETWSPERIKKTHPPDGVQGYVEPIDHKWFKPEDFPVGSTTDDTQLTLASMLGIVNGQVRLETVRHEHPPTAYMDAIAQAHAEVLPDKIGWGYSTVEAIERIKEGVHWSESGKTDKPMRGTGNGVVMKVAPLGVLKALDILKSEDFCWLCVAYSSMTHYSQMSALATLMHAHTISDILKAGPNVDLNGLCELWSSIHGWPAQIPGIFDISHLNETEDDISKRMQTLWGEWHDNKPISIEKRRELFGNGSCYLYDSLPFTYSFLLHPTDDPLDVLIDLVNAGGDTDTNGSMLGQMLGAMYGIELFEAPENSWTVEGLQGYAEIVATTKLFCDSLGIE
jgi:ADP-ribosylglycohydrolase